MVADRLLAVTGAETPQPEKATLLGLLRVLPQELPHLAAPLGAREFPLFPAHYPEAQGMLLAPAIEAGTDPDPAARPAERVGAPQPVRRSAFDQDRRADLRPRP